jgi:zinc D-Ala-D-Ala carboxypeptidase
MSKISKHISYKEAIHSDTAKRMEIDNYPSDYHLVNMQALAENIFEPLREWVGGPIKINSFFRSEKLNKAIKGSKSSQHMEGRSIDIDETYGYKTNAEMYNYIKDNLDFDQLIWEYGTEKNPDWVHVSYVSEDGNRGKCLRAKRINGKTVYINA